MLIVYPFGTPLYFAWEVYSNRQAIVDPNRILKEARAAQEARERASLASSAFVPMSTSRAAPQASRDPPPASTRETLAAERLSGADRVSQHASKWSAEETDQKLVGIAFLFESYKLSTFTLYAEVLDVYRRIILCSLVVFSGSTAVARCLWGIALATCWLQVFDWYRPFRTTRANTLAHFCNVTVLATFIAAFLLEDAPVDPGGLQLGWLLLFLNLALFGLACGQLRSEEVDDFEGENPRGLDLGRSTFSRNSSAFGMTGPGSRTSALGSDETVMTTNALFQLREFSLSATLDADGFSSIGRASGSSIAEVDEAKEAGHMPEPERGERRIKSWGAPAMNRLFDAGRLSSSFRSFKSEKFGKVSNRSVRSPSDVLVRPASEYSSTDSATAL